MPIPNPGLIAGYGKDNILNTVIEYGPGTSNPNMTYDVARRAIQEDCELWLVAANWEGLPDRYHRDYGFQFDWHMAAFAWYAPLDKLTRHYAYDYGAIF